MCHGYAFGVEFHYQPIQICYIMNSIYCGYARSQIEVMDKTK